MCNQPTNLLKPTRLNPIRRVGSVFRSGWVGLGWVMKIFFNDGLGLGHKNHNPLNQTRPIYIFKI